jgi:hypothetical protein
MKTPAKLRDVRGRRVLVVRSDSGTFVILAYRLTGWIDYDEIEVSRQTAREIAQLLTEGSA